MTASARVAVVLYGRIGALDHSDGTKFRSRDGGTASAPMLVMVYAAFVRHVLRPAEQSGTAVDVFGHSWSPEVEELLTLLWRPLALSVEAPLSTEVLTAACGRFQTSKSDCAGCSSRRIHRIDCERTRSQFLGMRRALLVKRRWEREHSAAYHGGAVLLARWDVLWERPLELAALAASLRPRAYVLPRLCQRRAVMRPAGDELKRRRVQVCGPRGFGSTLGSPLAADCAEDRFCLGKEKVARNSSEPRFTAAARQFFVLDQWLIGLPDDVHRLAELAEARTFEETTELVAAMAPARSWLVGHLYLGWHLLQRLNATMRFEFDEDIHWALARRWAGYDVCGGELSAGLPPRRRERRQVAGLRQSISPSLALEHSGIPLVQPAAMHGSCGDGLDFVCDGTSQRCRAAARRLRASDPMMHPAARAQFLYCATPPCAKNCSGTRAELYAHERRRVWRAPPEIAAPLPSPSPPSLDGRFVVGRLLALWYEVSEMQSVGSRVKAASGNVEQGLAALAARLLREERSAGAATWAEARRAAGCTTRGRVGSCGPADSRPPVSSRVWGNELGDCESGDSGVWPLPRQVRAQGADAIAQLCERRCRDECKRCRYISWSAAHGTCSWYRGCDLEALEYRFGGDVYVTMSVG